ncbi:hypothetical protein WBZ18_17250 [Clostridium botulinum]|uniref:Uncharacterized protein n=2 Tax=Clostridium botulinum TaxID=1491 RepID=A0A846HZK5_CLOBO|nr:hypothetical protein [Clostridium botulinum]AJD27252.1 putative membrane protein [Clostridium botulinum CDC_297]ACQ53430.1 putative membrane protein [Clostridium botulinum Ba4 str. 657]AJE10778.1 putative membrane protein [Clostridium botulinum CDC_1436]APR00749.1 putative membrane protein [Clostridium botulinum]APU59236.1 putative membrane protein [Clostridium botulinum]
MLKLSIVEFVARATPEAFLLIFAVYTFSNTRMNKKNYLLSSFLMLIMIFIIRSLPISYGIHTILSIMVLILLSYIINRIDVIRAVKSTIITIILQLICEGTNIFIIQYILKENMNHIFRDPNLKTIYGIPSLIIFACIIVLRYIRLLKRKELQYD